MTLSFEQFRERLIDYLYGELAGPERAEFEACLAESAECRRELEAMRDTLQLARTGLADLKEEPPRLDRRPLLDFAAQRASAARVESRPASGWLAWLRNPGFVAAASFATLALLAVLNRKSLLAPESDFAVAPTAVPAATPLREAASPADGAGENQATSPADGAGENQSTPSAQGVRKREADRSARDDMREEKAAPSTPRAGEHEASDHEAARQPGTSAGGLARGASAKRATQRRAAPSAEASDDGFGSRRAEKRSSVPNEEGPPRKYAEPPPPRGSAAPPLPEPAKSAARQYAEPPPPAAPMGGLAREKSAANSEGAPVSGDQIVIAPQALDSRGGGADRASTGRASAAPAPAAAADRASTGRASAAPAPSAAADRASTGRASAAPAPVAVAAPLPRYALIKRAREHLAQGRPREAARDYQELLRRFPQDPKVPEWRKQLGLANQAR